MTGWIVVRYRQGRLIADWDDQIYSDEFEAQQQLHAAQKAYPHYTWSLAVVAPVADLRP